MPQPVIEPAKVLDRQHPQLTQEQRFNVKNLCGSPREEEQYLSRLGFRVSRDPETRELLIWKQGDEAKYKVDPRQILPSLAELRSNPIGALWRAVREVPTDLSSDVASDVLRSGAVAVTALGRFSGVGTVPAAVVTGAVETGIQTLGMLKGVRDEYDGAAIAVAAVSGAAAPAVGRVISTAAQTVPAVAPALSGAAVSAGADAIRQGAQIALGKREEFDLGENIRAGATGAVFGAALGRLSSPAVGVKARSAPLSIDALRDQAQRAALAAAHARRELQSVVARELEFDLRIARINTGPTAQSRGARPGHAGDSDVGASHWLEKGRPREVQRKVLLAPRVSSQEVKEAEVWFLTKSEQLAHRQFVQAQERADASAKLLRERLGVVTPAPSTPLGRAIERTLREDFGRGPENMRFVVVHGEGQTRAASYRTTPSADQPNIHLTLEARPNGSVVLYLGRPSLNGTTVLCADGCTPAVSWKAAKPGEVVDFGGYSVVLPRAGDAELSTVQRTLLRLTPGRVYTIGRQGAEGVEIGLPATAPGLSRLQAQIERLSDGRFQIRDGFRPKELEITIFRPGEPPQPLLQPEVVPPHTVVQVNGSIRFTVPDPAALDNARAVSLSELERR